MEPQQLTEEDLKNMSPEELKELQKQNCIFCKIIAGQIPAKKIYEDDKCVAILDINPATPGHLLLLPKEHHAVMPLVPEDEQKYLFLIAKQLSHALLKAKQGSSTNIFLANGAVAGQRAPHVMIHIIPRNKNDEINCFKLPKHPIRPEDLKKLQLILRKTMAQMMKIEDKELEEEIKQMEQPAQPTPNPAQPKNADATKAPETKEPAESNKEASSESKPKESNSLDDAISSEFPDKPPKETKQQPSKEDKGSVDLDTISNLFK